MRIPLLVVVPLVALSCGAPENAPSDQTPDASVPETTELPQGPFGLPCAIEATLKENCWSCHGAPLTAPTRLVTRDDLLSPSKTAPEVTVAQVSLDRMQSGVMPPPPATVPAEQVFKFQEWVQAGAPAGACANGVDDPFSGPTVCTSNKTWTRGNRGSTAMNPGQACVSCHTRERAKGEDEAPDFDLAGTVYPTGHEPDNCVGANGTLGVKVVITDANNRVITLSVNSSGNFFHERRAGAIAMPYQAKVVFEGRERKMSASQTSGDCNSCHTVAGAEKAPGRIALP